MFSEELLNYIKNGREEVTIEYKKSLNWKDSSTKFAILRTMLAMANNDQGGVIVLGVKEDGNHGMSLSGMDEDDFRSFNYDDIARYAKGFCDPIIEFTIYSDTLVVNEKSLNFIVIQIRGSIEPTICTDYAKYDNNVEFSLKNIALRKNAIYIRSKAPIESREIANIHEWREFLDRIIAKKKDDIIKRLPCFNVSNRIIETDSNKFSIDLKNDNLL